MTKDGAIIFFGLLTFLGLIGAASYALGSVTAERVREQREACWAKHCPEPYEPVFVYRHCTCALVPR